MPTSRKDKPPTDRRVRLTNVARRSRWISARGIARFLDVTIERVKWPVAVLALLALPLTMLGGLRLILRIAGTPGPLLAFGLGLGLYVVVWYLFLRWRPFGSFFSTLEHELTHALFAVLTFHRVTELRSTFTRGGHVRFRGLGNWLITISPYFFTTICFAVLLPTMLLAMFLQVDGHWWTDAVLGGATAYHFLSTWRETHLRQTDLHRVGLLFSLLFLPTANIVSFAVVIAYCHDGLSGVGQFFVDCWPAFLF